MSQWKGPFPPLIAYQMMGDHRKGIKMVVDWALFSRFIYSSMKKRTFSSKRYSDMFLR